MTARDNIKKQVSLVLSNTPDNPTLNPDFDLVYDTALLSLLKQYHWNFCKEVWKVYNNPALTKTDPQYKFVYDLPANFLLLIRIGDYRKYYSFPDCNDGRDTKYDLRSGRIYTNSGIIDDLSKPNEAYIYVYGLKSVAEELFPAEFIEALVYRLAIRLVFKVADSADKLQAYQIMYKEYLDIAVSIHSKQDIPTMIPMSNFVKSKY